MQVILVSVDALVTEDLEVLRTLPFTGKLLERASVIERCTPIFPTHTYPCHASIMTGLTASGTGIIKNKNPDNEKKESTGGAPCDGNGAEGA